MASSFEWGNEPQSSITCGEFIKWLRTCKLLRKVSPVVVVVTVGSNIVGSLDSAVSIVTSFFGPTTVTYFTAAVEGCCCTISHTMTHQSRYDSSGRVIGRSH
jgi:hypothetical protein